jgi:hypothetical protein
MEERVGQLNDLSESEAAHAIDRALAEGRVNGRYRCCRCGMRSDSAAEAHDCCIQLAWPGTRLALNRRGPRS